MPRLALHALLRSAAFVVADVVLVQGWVDLGDDPVGAGLTAFAILAVLGGLWGTVDGWFHTTRHVIVMWLVAGAVAGATLAVQNQLGGPVDVPLLLSDLAFLVPFVGGLVAGPAIFMGAMVSQVRPRRSALPR